MKKLFIVFCFALSTSFVNSQTQDYYTNKSEIIGADYKYNIIINHTYRDVDSTFHVIVKNANNCKISNQVVLKDGRILNSMDVPWLEPLDAYSAVKLFKEVFSENEIKVLKQRALDYKKRSIYDKGLSLSIYFISDEDGNVIELQYYFRSDPVLMTIHPDKLYKYETLLKKEYKFIFPEILKQKYNYIVGQTAIIYFEKL